MVPIHESDVAENRWKVAEWSSVELWEKVELQLRQRRRWIIALAAILFFVLSAIPVVTDRYPKWRSLRVARRLAATLNRIKLEASGNRKAVWVSMEKSEGGVVLLQSRFAENCQESAASAPASTATRQDLFLNSAAAQRLSWMTPEEAPNFGLERIVRQVCFDSHQTTEGPEVAFAIVPVKDLTTRRTDRISFVFFNPQSAEISFD